MPLPDLFPPFSPVRLAGILARPLPPAVLNPVLATAMAVIRKRYPDVFERLAVLGAPVFLIDPVELPFVFVLSVDPDAPQLRATHNSNNVVARATIQGPFMLLIELMEGRIDGDSLFFSRDLLIEGDTESVVALRNAVDGAGIDVLGSLISLLGPLAEPVQHAADMGARVIGARPSLPARVGRRRAPLPRCASGNDPTALELVCPAGTPAALRTAVDSGADAVYLGFRDATNARNFPGLNFSRGELAEGLRYAHDNGVRILVAINTFPKAGNAGPWHQAVDDAAALGVDAIILADIGLADYAARTYPDLRLHLSVQAAASNPEAIRFYVEAFGVKRVVLPRVLTLTEIAALNAEVPVETEIFVFGGLCVMAEGRCALSSYVTGQSPNVNGVCSPADCVSYEKRGDQLVSRLGDVTVNVFEADEAAGYPTLCKGRFSANNTESYLFEEPTSLDAATMLPELMAAGVSALKIEGRQRGRAYVGQVVSAFRRAIDAATRGEPVPPLGLETITEGQRKTAGAYNKTWR
jgi:O2-independent ubiquinone biosynthesis protein UbiU